MVLASALLAGLYALARLVASRPPRLAPTVLALLGAGAGASAISAPQVLPFAEYFRASYVSLQSRDSSRSSIRAT